jgi:hypothetical protein
MIAAAFIFTMVAIVGLTFAVRALLTAAGQRAGQRIARIHRDLEEIVEHGRIPAAWIHEAKQRTKGAHDAPAQDAPAQERARMQRFLLRRLAEMRSYCLKSSMVDGPETLELLLEGLDRAKRELTEQGLGKELP